MMKMPPNSSSEIVFPTQSNDRTNLYILGVTSFIVIATISWLWFKGSPDFREPPELKPKVPLVGHLLGLIQHQAEYFVQLTTGQSWSIVTLKIFTSRVYVVTCPELVQAVFRNSKSLSFDPIAATGSARILAITKDKMKQVEANPLDGKHSTWIQKATTGMHVSMQPGASLLQMNSRALNLFAVFLSEIGTTKKRVDLYTWVRDHFTLASAEAMYGHENPIADDPSLIQSLEEFEASIGLLFLNILPSITARKGYRARLAYRKAFNDYYARGLLKNASGLIQGRYRDLTSSGLTYSDVAAIEIAMVMATTMNSVNGAFWMLCYLFSDPQLLSEIRAEVSMITSRRSGDGIDEVCLDVSQLQKSCPLLVSAWQETLRMEDVVVSQRVVLEDTLLNKAHFLRKGAIVQIPSRIMHESGAIWGSDSHTFNARRFLKANSDQMSREQKKLQKQGFIPFGGGAVLCPGRHFATTETLGIAATILMGYEIRMADGEGPLRLPKGQKQRMGVAVKVPENGLEVVIQRKKEFEGVKWTYDIGGEVGDEDMVF